MKLRSSGPHTDDATARQADAGRGSRRALPLLVGWILTLAPTLVLGAPPTANPDAFVVDEGLTISRNVLGNDSDPDGDSFVAELVTGPASHVGAFTLNPDGSFTYQHDGSETSADSFTYAAVDANDERSAATTVSITVDPVNDRPTITGQVPLSTPEETPLTITVGDLSIVDPDSSSFTLDVRDGANYSVSGNTITPATDFNGELVVPVTVDDGSGEANSESEVFPLRVTVDPVNDRPTITGQAPLSTPEETPLTITVGDLSIVDPDSSSFTLDVRDGANYSVSGNTITPDTNFDGQLTVQVTVDDRSGAANSESAPFALTVSVGAANDQPVITGQDPLATDEETPLTITVGDLSIVDPDSSSFTLDVRDGANYSVSGNTITPDANFNGQLTVQVTVDDRSGAANSESATFGLTVSVSAQNDPPEVLSPIGNRSATEDQSIVLDLSANFVDPDGDPLSYTANGLPPSGNLALSPAGLLSGTARDEDVGTWNVTVTARDPGGLTGSDTFALTVINVNDRPLISGQRPLATEEETPLTLSAADLVIEDPDSSSFTLEVRPGANYTVAGTTITPATDFDGTLSVPVTVDDGSGAANSRSPVFEVTVSVAPGNDRPLITGQRPVATDEDTPRTIVPLDLVVVDPDSEFPGDFSVIVGGGPNYSRDGATITPDEDFNGTLTVPVRVDDGSGEPNSRSESFDLLVTVNPVNDRPVVSGAVGNQSTSEGELFRLDVSGVFSDVDGDPLTFTATGQPGSLDISGAGILSGTPGNDDVGDYTVTVRASDPSQASATTSFELTIVNVNDQPRIIGQSTLITPEETPLEITLAALVVADPDNRYPQDFTLSVGRGDNYRLNGDTITPDNEFSGVLAVPVTVDDGSGAPNSESDEFMLSVSVTSQNDVPVITGQKPSPLRVDEDKALRIRFDNLLVEDPDDVYPDDFTLTIEPGADYRITAPDTIRPAADFNGLLVVNVTVSDAEATSPVFGLRVDVQPVNDRPVITGQRPLSTDEETPITVTVSDLIVDDPDLPAQTLTLTLEAGENYTLDGNTVTPAADFSGALTVPATVNDGETDSAVFDLLITVDAVNDLPVITGQLPLTTPEDTPLTVTLADLTVEDPDNEYPADFSLTVLPGDNYAVDDASLVPAADFAGTLAVPVTVNDGSDDSEPFVLEVTVTPVNDPPAITGQRQLVTAEDTPITIVLTDLTVDDPDNVFPEEFTLALAAGENYTVSGTTVTPLSNYNGRLDVPATVSDGAATSEPFVLRIRVDAANDAPTLVTPIPDQQAVENEFYRLDVSSNFEDADGDTLRFSISGLPDTDNLSFDPDTGVLSGTPDFSDTRDFPFTVVVTATDESDASGSGSFELTIAALDRANVALEIAATPSPALLDDQVRYTFTVTNAGPSAATDLGLSGQIFGTGLEVTAGAGAECAIDAPVAGVTDFDCTLPNVAPGTQSVVVFNILAGESGDIMVAAEAAGRRRIPVDPNVGDNSDQVSVSVARELSNGAIQALGSANVRSVATADVDGDGDPDLILGTGAGQAAEIYLGTGVRTFEETPILIADNAPNEGVAAADLDADGDPDLVFANGAGLPDTIYTNDGSGGFLPLVALTPRDSRDVVVADFNGDGRPDLAFAAIAGNPVYLNDDGGGYVLIDELGNAASLGVASADFNGDGWPDLVFANSGATSRIYLNDGGSGFLPPRTLDIGNATAVAVVRADGNNSPDLVFARVPGEVGDLPANPVLVNDGAGNFSETQALGAAPTLDVLVGDIDGDGRDDLIFINETGTHQVWRGSGGGFRLNAEQIVNEDAVAGVVGDLGNDGGDDLATTAGTQGGGTLFLNDGFGRLGFGDAIPPVLELVGSTTIEIEAGTRFVDPGVLATDNIDGDISTRIEIDNPVNSTVVGTYRITYRVSDFAGNQAQPVSRSVRVIPAAGTGGGGGGSVSGLELLLLLAALIAGRRAGHTGKLRWRAPITDRNTWMRRQQEPEL